MNYVKFRNRCIRNPHLIPNTLSLLNESPKDTIPNPAIMMVMQKILDNTFEAIITFNSNRLTKTPLWLLDLYNDFVRLVENDEIAYDRKIVTTLHLMKQLFAEVYREMGDQWVQRIFKKQICNDSIEYVRKDTMKKKRKISAIKRKRYKK